MARSWLKRWSQKPNSSSDLVNSVRPNRAGAGGLIPQAHQSVKACMRWSCLWEMPSSPLHSQQEARRAGFQLGALPLGFPSSFLPPPQEAGEFAPVICRHRAPSHSLHSCNDGNQGPARVSHQAAVLGKLDQANREQRSRDRTAQPASGRLLEDYSPRSAQISPWAEQGEAARAKIPSALTPNSFQSGPCDSPASGAPPPPRAQEPSPSSFQRRV